MPVPGVPNNATGENGFSHFAPEPAYGEKIQLKRLGGMAPLAGGVVAAGPLNAARQAQNQAGRKPKPPPKPIGGIVGPVPPDVSPLGWPNVYPPGTIQNKINPWTRLLAVPGANRHPILAYYAGLR